MRRFITLCLFVLTLASCTTHDDNSFCGSCLTLGADEIMENQATLHGRINHNEGRYDDYTFGVIVSESDNPNLSNGYLFSAKEVNSQGDFAIIVSPLAQDTHYYYRAYVYNRNVYQYGEVRQLKTQPFSFGLEAVDLGLSVKWASFDIGARIPGEQGAKFAWGEVSEKEEYTWFNYKWGYSYRDESKIYHYVFHKYGGAMHHDNAYAYLENAPDDGKRRLDLLDDAAHAIWGHGWHIPTKDNCEELVKLCSFSQENVEGILGVKVTGSNGKSIFFSAPSTQYNESEYWSSDLLYHMGDQIDDAITLKAYVDSHNGDRTGVFGSSKSRQYGLYIRPVHD